jgi:hypothetical protein
VQEIRQGGVKVGLGDNRVCVSDLGFERDSEKGAARIVRAVWDIR